MESVQLSKYIRLGAMLVDLPHRNGWLVPKYVNYIQQGIDALETLDFQSAHAVAHDLAQYCDRLERRFVKDLTAFRDGVPEEELAEVARLIRPVFNALYHEADRRYVITLNQSSVSHRLRNLGSKIVIDEKQQVLHDETIRCMECGAYRAAMNMAWQLAYDYIRRWIYDNTDHRNKFNDELQKRKRTANANHEPIVAYEDFFSLQERDVLTLANKAALINQKLFDRLVTWLNLRNSVSHPSSEHPESEQAMGQIIELLNIIESPAFKAHP